MRGSMWTSTSYGRRLPKTFPHFLLPSMRHSRSGDAGTPHAHRPIPMNRGAMVSMLVSASFSTKNLVSYSKARRKAHTPPTYAARWRTGRLWATVPCEVALWDRQVLVGATRARTARSRVLAFYARPK